MTSAITFFSALECEVRLVSPGYDAHAAVAAVGLSDHYYDDHNTANSPLRATHMYTSINSKTVRTTHKFTDANDDCTILFLPGGSAPDYMQNMSSVVSVVRSFARRKSIIASNCNGTKLLLDVVKGLELTGPSLVKAQVNQSQNLYLNNKVKVNFVRERDLVHDDPNATDRRTGCVLITAGPLYYNYMIAEIRLRASI